MLTMDLITRDFLEETIGVRVISFQVNSGSAVGQGYASDLFSVDVICERRRPLHLIIKAFPKSPSRQAYLIASNMFRKELLVYTTLIPELIKFQLNPGSIYSCNVMCEKIIHPPFPDCLWGQAIDYREEGAPEYCENPLDNSIILPNLKVLGYRLANRGEGFDLDHCKLVIVAQAKLHAVSWAYKQQTNARNLNDKFPFLKESVIDILPDQIIIDGMLTTHLALFQDVVEQNAEDEEEREQLLDCLNEFEKKFLDVFALYFCDIKTVSHPTVNKDNILRRPLPHNPDERPWLTVTHGDSWLNNMMFRYDEVTEKPTRVLFIDLQATRENDPFTDLAYCLYTSTTAEFRRQHLDELLKLYVLTFIQVCEHFKVIPFPGFQLSEVKRRFHRAKALGMAMALHGLPIFLNYPNNNNNNNNNVDDNSGSNDTEEDIIKSCTNMVRQVRENRDLVNKIMGLLRELRDDGVI